MPTIRCAQLCTLSSPEPIRHAVTAYVLLDDYEATKATECDSSREPRVDVLQEGAPRLGRHGVGDSQARNLGRYWGAGLFRAATDMTATILAGVEGLFGPAGLTPSGPSAAR
jgi:hypothetical protein